MNNWRECSRAASWRRASSCGRKFSWPPTRGFQGGIAGALQVSGSTIYRTKRRFVADNLEGALSDEPRPGAERKLSTKETALLAATACSAPPPGRARWTLELLADEMVKLTDHDELSRETVRRRLAENHLKPWRRTMWCIPKVDGEYVARMEDVLDLYAQPPDPLRPVICFDESPTQLIGEVRQPIPAEPGQLERYDCEYRRNGTVNLFIFLDANRSWRKVKVTDRRTNKDFAECMRDLVDLHYPTASAIRLVMDNLSNSFHRRALRRFSGARGAPHPQADRVPLHAKTRQLAEQGRNRNGVLRGQCLDRRIEDKAFLISEIAAWKKAETTVAQQSNGPSQPKKLAKNSKKPIQSKNHDHCATVLARMASEGR